MSRRPGPHVFTPDPALPADHNGRRVCAGCHLIGEPGDPHHEMPDVPVGPDARERAAGEEE